MKKKNPLIWILLMTLPLPAFILLAVLETVALQFAKDGSTTLLIVNILAFSLGVIAFISLLCIPLWIIRYNRVIKYNKTLEQEQSQQKL